MIVTRRINGKLFVEKADLPDLLELLRKSKEPVYLDRHTLTYNEFKELLRVAKNCKQISWFDVVCLPLPGE